MRPLRELTEPIEIENFQVLQACWQWPRSFHQIAKECTGRVNSVSGRLVKFNLAD